MTSALENRADQSAGEVLDRVRPQLAAYLAEAEGESLTVEELAQRMLDAIPRRSVLDLRAGPFHRRADVSALLGVSRQAVHERVKRGRMLAVDTADGTRLFPTFQFEGGRVHPEVANAIEALSHAAVDGWTIALWLTADHGGVTALAALKSGSREMVRDILAEAEDDAARWAA